MAKRYEEMTPSERAAVDTIRARRRTPAARAEQERVRRAVMAEFPPAPQSPPTPEAQDPLRASVGAHLAALGTLKHERERRGLSLADVAERSGLDRGYLSRLENGRILNPTLLTVERYAAALGKRVALVIRDEEPTGG